MGYGWPTKVMVPTLGAMLLLMLSPQNFSTYIVDLECLRYCIGDLVKKRFSFKFGFLVSCIFIICVGSNINFLQLLDTVPGVMQNAPPNVIKYFIMVPQRFYEGR